MGGLARKRCGIYTTAKFRRDADLHEQRADLEQVSACPLMAAVGLARQTLGRPQRRHLAYGHLWRTPPVLGAATFTPLAAQNTTQRPRAYCGAGIVRDRIFTGLLGYLTSTGSAVMAVTRKHAILQPHDQGHDLVALVRSKVGRFQCRGLRREDAAAYIGISPTKFDDWVKRRLMPGPKRQDGIVVWDRLALDAAFEILGGEEDLSIWNDLKV